MNTNFYKSAGKRAIFGLDIIHRMSLLMRDFFLFCKGSSPCTTIRFRKEKVLAFAKTFDLIALYLIAIKSITLLPKCFIPNLYLIIKKDVSQPIAKNFHSL